MGGIKAKCIVVSVSAEGECETGEEHHLNTENVHPMHTMAAFNHLLGYYLAKWDHL